MVVTKIRGLKEEIAVTFPVTTIEECSYDSNNSQVLVNNNSLKVYNFDYITQELVKTLENPQCKVPDSLDSLYLEEDSIIFIEFKNSFWNDIKSNDIRMKMYESIVLLSRSYNLDFEDIKGLKVFIIHKADENPVTHRYTNGLCPKNFLFLEETLGIEIMRYDAANFENYINKYSFVPSRN